jgi:hypothetical protein
MAKYVLGYRGGAMAQTPEEQEQVMAAWGEWFGRLGSAVVDGGNPFAGSKSVGPDGSVSDGAPSGLTGYSVLQADSLDGAVDVARGCPILSSGGSVDVYETIEMG